MMPVAWMKGYRSYHGPSEPDEYDVECYAGEDPPDNQPGWVPLVPRDSYYFLLEGLRSIAHMDPKIEGDRAVLWAKDTLSGQIQSQAATEAQQCDRIAALVEVIQSALREIAGQFPDVMSARCILKHALDQSSDVKRNCFAAQNEIKS